jgi:hypothetical protein
MQRYLVMLVLASNSLSSLIGAASANAAPRERCFQETGYCLNPPTLYAFSWADGRLEIVSPQALR